MSDFIDFFRKDWIAKYYGENFLVVSEELPEICKCLMLIKC
jgi:hypothetical protein